MSYKDIEAARAKRAEQEANKEAKGKRKPGWPKRVVSEAEAAATADKGNVRSVNVLRRRKRKGKCRQAEHISQRWKVHHNLIEPQRHACGSGGL
jgi:hypothetical protein